MTLNYEQENELILLPKDCLSVHFEQVLVKRTCNGTFRMEIYSLGIKVFQTNIRSDPIQSSGVC